MAKIVPSITKKNWKIPEELTTDSNRMRLVEMLTSFNKINRSTSYYIRDSYEQKIIVDSPSSTIL